MLLACVLALLLPLWSSFGILLLLYSLQAAALAPVTSIADALALGNIAKSSFRYGRLRGTASAAFVIGTLIIGYIIGQTNLDAIAYGQAALLGIASVFAFAMRWDAAAVQSARFIAVRGGVAELWCIASFRRVVLLAALVYGSHAVHDAFAVIRWNASGLEPTLTAVLWSEAVVAEVAVFVFIGPRLIDKLGTHGAAALAAAMGVVRWVVMGLTTAAVAVSMVQPLHGFTFALTHLACMRIIGGIVPGGLSSTAQALYALGGGMASVVLTVLAGPIFASYGGGAFFLMAVLCALAVPIAWSGLREE
jgi:PPP family 3-phenylpropionic acid transporter